MTEIKRPKVPKKKNGKVYHTHPYTQTQGSVSFYERASQGCNLKCWNFLQQPNKIDKQMEEKIKEEKWGTRKRAPCRLMEKKLTLQHGGLCQRLVRQYKEKYQNELHLKSLESLNACWLISYIGLWPLLGSLHCSVIHRSIDMLQVFTIVTRTDSLKCKYKKMTNHISLKIKLCFFFPILESWYLKLGRRSSANHVSLLLKMLISPSLSKIPLYSLKLGDALPAAFLIVYFLYSCYVQTGWIAIILLTVTVIF